MSMPPWRAGRKVFRTLYVGDDLVGLMDTAKLADLVVTRVNAYDFLEQSRNDALLRAEHGERLLHKLKTQLDDWEKAGRSIVNVKMIRGLVVEAKPPHVDLELPGE